MDMSEENKQERKGNKKKFMKSLPLNGTGAFMELILFMYIVIVVL